MFSELKNNDLIITNNKKYILKYLNNNQRILNVKIMSLNEFKDEYFGYYDERAIYHLTNKYNYKYSIAKLYLDNYLFIPELKEELEKNNLIIKNEMFKSSISRIVVVDVEIDPYIQKEIDKYENIKINTFTNNYINHVYEFKNITDEVEFVCSKISNLLKTVDINKIFLVNVTSEYESIIKRTFNLFNIPINLNNKKNIYGTLDVQNFIQKLNQTKNIEESLKEVVNDNIYNEIVNICNRYSFKELDDTIIYCIIEELKNAKINYRKMDNAVNVIKLEEINDDENYYFILGFNQGIIPKIYKDEDYLSDLKKEKLGIFTSLEKNILEKSKVEKIIKNYKNLFISYKLKAKDEEYFKSTLIEDLNLETKKDENKNYNISNLYNELYLSRFLDDYIKFNKKSNDLSILHSNYNSIPYLKYDNKYKKINKESLKKYIDNKLVLSYSSMDNYYKCGFKYYVENILKLNKYEETFSIYIGNLFHYILSIAFKDDFNFEYEFNNYIKDKSLNNKEKFFINKLKKDLLFTISVIKKQDKYIDLSKSLYEKKVFINKDRNIKITFMGIIDKLRYDKFNDKTIVAIIDYKTGNTDINLNNSFYGIGMQLPIYLYLSQNLNIKNIEVAGFYIQKIIHNKFNYEENKEYDLEFEKLYKLNGYSNNDESILSKFDKSYKDSEIIKSMKITQKGFYAYSKVLNNNQINNLINLVDDKINNAIDNIIDANFDINPKKIGQDLVGCEYCKYKDICYMKEEDIINLKEQNYKDFLGGE